MSKKKEDELRDKLYQLKVNSDLLVNEMAARDMQNQFLKVEVLEHKEVNAQLLLDINREKKITFSSGGYKDEQIKKLKEQNQEFFDKVNIQHTAHQAEVKALNARLNEMRDSFKYYEGRGVSIIKLENEITELKAELKLTKSFHASTIEEIIDILDNHVSDPVRSRLDGEKGTDIIKEQLSCFRETIQLQSNTISDLQEANGNQYNRIEVLADALEEAKKYKTIVADNEAIYRQLKVHASNKLAKVEEEHDKTQDALEMMTSKYNLISGKSMKEVVGIMNDQQDEIADLKIEATKESRDLYERRKNLHKTIDGLRADAMGLREQNSYLEMKLHHATKAVQAKSSADDQSIKTLLSEKLMIIAKELAG